MLKKIVFFIISSIIIPGKIWADEPTAALSAQLTVPSLIQQIQTAKDMLQSVKLNYQINPIYKNIKPSGKKTAKTKKILAGHQLAAKDLAVAVLNPNDNRIAVIKASQNGKTFKFADENFEIQTLRFNGVNTRFKVKMPEGGIVLALKYLITPVEKGNKSVIEKQLYETVYVPYSDKINQPEVLAFGKQYLDNVFATAEADLANTPSVALAGKKITEAIPASLVKAIIFAEHLSTGEFVLSTDGELAASKIYTQFAANEGDTFNHSVSSAKARGLAQFVERTYLSLVKRHPEAGLMGDFVPAMNSHKNAVKAIYLLLDDHVGTIRRLTQSDFNPAYVWEYAAASYNGGTTRVARAIKNFSTKWDQDKGSQLKDIQTDIDARNLEIKSLKKQIKAAKDKKQKAALNARLGEQNQMLAETKTQLEKLKSAALRQETVFYLHKIRQLMQEFNE